MSRVTIIELAIRARAPRSPWIVTIMMLLPASLLVGSMWGTNGKVGASVPADPLGNRLTVSVFRFAGSEEGEARTHFSRFKGMVRDKMTVLVEELPEFGYLRGLKLEPPGNDGFEDTLTDEIAAQQYWRLSRSLILLRGSIVPETGNGYYAQSRLFLGDLRGSLPHPSVSVRLPISSEQFGNTNDAYSLAVYYALAMDAVRTGERPARVVMLLSRAEDKIRDLRRGSVPGDVDAIQGAVERAISLEKTRSGLP
jgi:hypothetical protein